MNRNNRRRLAHTGLYLTNPMVGDRIVLRDPLTLIVLVVADVPKEQSSCDMTGVLISVKKHQRLKSSCPRTFVRRQSGKRVSAVAF